MDKMENTGKIVEFFNGIRRNNARIIYLILLSIIICFKFI